MNTEVTPKIRSGFWLDSVNLVRLKDTLNEQLKKVNDGGDAQFVFEVKYANGAIYSTESLDEILNDENDGSKRIVRLVIAAHPTITSAHLTGFAEVRFSDTSFEENSDDVPIAFSVKCPNRDWAFVTTSMIDERIGKIRLGRVSNYVTDRSRDIVLTLMTLSLGIFTSTVLYTSPSAEAEWIIRLGEIKEQARDVVGFMYDMEVERARRKIGDLSYAALMPAFLIFTVIFIFLFRHVQLWLPRYTFYWGDQKNRYDRKVSILRFVALAVVFTIPIGIAINFVSGKLF
jgi:hypothetical protein